MGRKTTRIAIKRPILTEYSPPQPSENQQQRKGENGGCEDPAEVAVLTNQDDQVKQHDDRKRQNGIGGKGDDLVKPAAAITREQAKGDTDGKGYQSCTNGQGQNGSCAVNQAGENIAIGFVRSQDCWQFFPFITNPRNQRRTAADVGLIELAVFCGIGQRKPDVIGVAQPVERFGTEFKLARNALNNGAVVLRQGLQRTIERQQIGHQRGNDPKEANRQANHANGTVKNASIEAQSGLEQAAHDHDPSEHGKNGPQHVERPDRCEPHFGGTEQRNKDHPGCPKDQRQRR